MCEWDEVTAALLGAFWVAVPAGWARAGRGASGCWQRARAQLLTTDLGHCLCVSDLKSLLFSMLVNVMKKERKKKGWVSLRRQGSYLVALPSFLISGLQMQVAKHTSSQLNLSNFNFRGMAT